VRGIPLAFAGLASATSAGCALGATVLAGSVADRFGARATLVGGLVLSTCGFALYPAVREGWHAVLVATLTGSGVGAWIMSQSALLVAITPPELRPIAFAQQRVVANVGLGLGGFAGGLLVTASDPASFTVLFLLNAGTFLAYLGFALGVPAARPERRSGEARSGYRSVLRDGLFVRFALLNFAFVAAAISLLVGLLPVYLLNEAGSSESSIGLLFLLNSVAIIAAQLPVARAQQGRRRMVAFAQMGALFAASWLLVLLAGSALAARPALVAIVAAITLFSLAECLYDAVQGPLTAELAPAGLTGRYMAVNGFSWQLGFIVGPAVGAAILGAEPHALWVLAAAVCAVAGASALVLERRLPEAAQLTPVAERRVSARSRARSAGR
jgi:MFS family permease